MESMMHIGNAPGAPDYAAIAEAISGIFFVAHETRMEQEMIQAALETFTKISQVSHVTVTNSTFTNNPPVAEPADACLKIDRCDPDVKAT